MAVDFGAGSIKLAEFEQNQAGGLCLKQYGTKALGIEGAQESTREATILKALQEVLSEKGFGTKHINACAPGFHVFSKFVKLPPVDTSKVTQIIRYEAQQNVPFPLEEVVWDYQILGTTATNELEVLLVAVKSEVVEGLFKVAEGAGLRVNLVDVSPAALCNAFRYNYGDLEGCTMLLDIGAKTSNVLFFEKGKVYSRSISIGANSITHDFANEAKLKFAQAEAIKIEKGFVSLGGAYEEPEDPQAAAISKIARQVMTRLHLQVNQTIQFYRSQQGGTPPQRMFLSGGASIMPYTAQFFAEKFNIPVEYFNPFRNIEISPSLDLDELSKYAHLFGEVVGLGLRDLAHCPVELNLMPKSSIKRQEFSQKKPYFIAAMFSLVLVVASFGFAEGRMASARHSAAEAINLKATPLKKTSDEFNKEKAARDALKKQTEALADQSGVRTYWIDILKDLRQTMLDVEKTTKASYHDKKIDTDLGVWVEVFSPVLPANSPFSSLSGGAVAVNALTGGPRGARRGGRRRPGAEAAEAAPAPVADPAAAPADGSDPTAAAAATGSEVKSVNLVCRAIDREKISPTINNDIAYLVRDRLNSSPWVATNSVILGEIKKDDTNTFTFTISLQLKRPFKL